MTGLAYLGSGLVYALAAGSLLAGLLRSATASSRIAEEQPQDRCTPSEEQDLSGKHKHLSTLPTAS
jgi:hypothetical protein